MWSLFMAEALAQAVCVEGSCPAQLSLQIQAVTPAGRYALVQGSGLGSGRLASGPCRGSTGLSGPTLLERGRADYNGRAVSFAEPTAACGTGYLSVLDMTTCTFSTPVALVGSSSCGGATWGVRPGDFYDFDVADSGATVEIFGDGAAMRATCTGADGVEVASGVWLGQDGVETFAAVSVSDVSERAIVVWRSLWHGSAERLRYAYLDETCTPIVTDALIDENAYFEFFDVALDDAGSGVLALNEGETKLYWISADGSLAGPQSAFDLGDEYGVHVALDRDGTGGIVAAQEHSGDGIWYRRFSGRGRFIEPGPVWVEDVSYHYWYDGFTVGMNDDGRSWSRGGRRIARSRRSRSRPTARMLATSWRSRRTSRGPCRTSPTTASGVATKRSRSGAATSSSGRRTTSWRGPGGRSATTSSHPTRRWCRSRPPRSRSPRG